MDVSKEQFQAFKRVRDSGLTNMFDSNRVVELADELFEIELTREDCRYIIGNWSKLEKEYGDV